MTTLILLRHGQSTYNAAKRFCGWTDAPLSEQGIAEAKHAGQLMAKHGFALDRCFTSYLSRAIKTLWLSLEEMNLMWLPVEKSWRLNERHYGGLQGLVHADMAAQVGDEQVHIWRRSFDVAPPALSLDDERHPKFDPRYAQVDPAFLPAHESLKDTIARIMPYWNESIAPCLKNNETILISAHGNSLRALVKFLDNISDQDIPGYEIPTGVPLVYHLDEQLTPLRSYYLTDQGEEDRLLPSS